MTHTLSHSTPAVSSVLVVLLFICPLAIHGQSCNNLTLYLPKDHQNTTGGIEVWAHTPELPACPISADIFSPFVKLAVLTLAGLNLHDLPLGLFAHNPYLYLVTITAAPLLTQLPEDLFATNTMIRELDISSCSLTTLPVGLVDATRFCTGGDFHKNNISSLPPHLFDHCDQVPPQVAPQLLLSQNKMSMLPEGIVSDWTRLQNLDLSFNVLQTVSPNALRQTEVLITLLLSHNLLSALPRDLFRNCGHLRLLHLEYNSLTVLSGDLLNNTGKLQVFNVAHNQLTLLPRGLFHNATYLVELHLEFNQITALPIDLFVNVTSLQHFTMNDNVLVCKTPNLTASCNCTRGSLVMNATTVFCRQPRPTEPPYSTTAPDVDVIAVGAVGAVVGVGGTIAVLAVALVAGAMMRRSRRRRLQAATSGSAGDDDDDDVRILGPESNEEE